MIKTDVEKTATEIGKRELPINERVELYEKFEKSLREFFDSTDFCYQNCFSKGEKKVVIGWIKFRGNVFGPGNEGCCHKEGKNFYEFLYGLDCFYIERKRYTQKYEEEFQKIRSKNIKRNISQTGTCKYHTNSGCAIKKFRSPLCNTWICEKYQNYLLDKFNISYSGEYYSDNSVKSLISIIFDKEINVQEIEGTLLRIESAINRIKNHNQNRRYKKRIKI